MYLKPFLGRLSIKLHQTFIIMILSTLNFWNLLKTIVQSKAIDFSTFLSSNFYNSCESKFYEKFHWKMAKVDSFHREDSIHKGSLYVEILCWSIAFSLTKLLFIEKSFIHVWQKQAKFHRWHNNFVSVTSYWFCMTLYVFPHTDCQFW